MTPQPVDATDLSPRARRRKRFERVGVAVNGLVFLIGAWDGLETHGPIWAIAVNAILGLAQLGLLARSQGGPLPERFPFVLAALGMFLTSLTLIHHRSALPVLYALAGLLNAAQAVYGPEAIRRLVRREPRAAKAP